MKTNMRAITDHFANDSTPLVGMYRNASSTSNRPEGQLVIYGRSTVDGRPLYVPGQLHDDFDGGFVFETETNRLEFIAKAVTHRPLRGPQKGVILDLSVAKNSTFLSRMRNRVLEADVMNHAIMCSGLPNRRP